MINKVDIPADQWVEYDTAISFPKVTRFEVIGNGREYVKYGVRNVWASVQDDGRTVKIFIEYDVDEEISND